MMKRHCLFVRWMAATWALSAVSAWAAANGAVDADTGAYVITVASGAADVTLSAEDVTALGTSVDLVKKGAGRLIINTNLKTAKWGGELRVEEGYLRVQAYGSLGTNAKGTIVSDGATLEIDGSTIGANKYDFVSGDTITVTGQGMCVDGVYMGVIRNVANDQYPGFLNVTMLGDCLFSSAKSTGNRLDVRSGTLDMNGHTLTTRGNYALTAATVANPGHIVVDTGYFVIESSTKLNGDDTHVMTMNKGTVLSLQQSRVDLPWKLILNDTCKIQTASGLVSTYNTWSGPVELVSGTITTYSNYLYVPIKFKGPISGAGRLKVTGNYGSFNQVSGIELLNANNTFSGGLEIASQMMFVRVASPGGLPHGETDGSIVLSAADCSLQAYVGDDTTTTGWSAADYRALVAKASCTGTGSAVVMYNDAGQVKTYDADVTDNGPYGFGGDGALNLTGAWSTGDLSIYGGVVTASVNGVQHVRYFNGEGGTLVVPQNSCVYAHTNGYLGAHWPNIAKIRVENGGCFMTSNAAPTGVYSFSVGRPRGSSGRAYRGIIDLQSGACMTGRICVGLSQSANDAAALYLRPGATFRSWGTGGSCDMYNGSSGSSYVEISGGTLYMPGWTIVGNGGTGRGVWVQSGGTATMAGDAFSIAASGAQGEAYFSGGTFTSYSELHVGKSVWSYAGRGGRAAMTVTGSAVVTDTKAVDLAMQTNCLAALNLNGGVLATPYIQKMTNISTLVSSSGRKDEPFDDNTAYVNFNGGTLKAYANGELFRVAPDAVNVYPGGAVFDTAGYTCTVGVPLVAPTGKGVASIPLPASCSVPWNYIGSPYVTIDGDGTNAWAHAIFDSVNGVVTGIEITNPGTDYTWAKATLAYGGWTNQVVVTGLSLADNATGGLTKKGLGVLTLLATNSFSGPVTVEGGTLIARNDHALPTSTFDLNLTGGTLDGGRQTWNFGAISATSGGLENVSSATTASSLVKTGTGTFDLNSHFAIGSTIKVEAGTLTLPQVGPGLWEAAHAHPTNTPRIAEYDASPVFKESISTSLAYLYTNGVSATSLWKSHMNVFYSGCIWNTNETDQTWCFGGVMDDGIKVVIDGQQVLFATGWQTPRFGKMTVSPGAHSLYIACYNATGGAGATGCGSSYAWPAKHGLVWNPAGAFNENGTVSTNFADYVDFVNPTNGAVLSLNSDGYTSIGVTSLPIEVAAGATVAVGDGAYAFTTYKGLGSITGSTSIQTWTIDGAEVAAGGKMHVTGNLTFPEGAAFELENVASLPSTGAATVIATVDGEVTGRLPSVNVTGSGVWSVYTSGHDLKLALTRGTVLTFR